MFRLFSFLPSSFRRNFRFASVEEKEVIISECWPVPRHR
jgi:hypothetical protein